MIKRKIELQNEVFEGISSVYAMKGGLNFTIDQSGSDKGDATLSITEGTGLYEFPVSDDSGFNFDTGAPSIENFKIKGLNAAWVNTFTPGDGSITLEIPCSDTDIVELCFGNEAVQATVSISSGVIGTAAVSYVGAAFASPQKAVNLGLMILNDTEDMMLYIKKAKFMAQLIFDGSNKPLCVVLTGNIANSADSSAIGILKKQVA